MGLKKLLGEVLFWCGSHAVRYGLDLGGGGGGATLIRSQRYIDDERKAAEHFRSFLSDALKNAGRECTCPRCTAQRHQTRIQAN